MSGVEIVPVTPERFDDLADLFGSNAATRGCWCMYFVGERADVHARWRTGGNRDAFEELARVAQPPMGLLAYDGGTPAAWCAMGPRSRYPRLTGPRAKILKERDAAEDDDVWLIPCFFARVGHRRKGMTAALLDAAVDIARRHGARAVEGVPIADARGKTPDDYFGTERLFASCGFECVARPSDRRAVMRLDLR